jgi:hypothetical protein
VGAAPRWTSEAKTALQAQFRRLVDPGDRNSNPTIL